MSTTYLFNGPTKLSFLPFFKLTLCSCLSINRLGIRHLRYKVIAIRDKNGEVIECLARAMQSKQINVEKESQLLLPPKKEQGLRRVFSEASSIIPQIASIVNTIEELDVECECCGMSEECTPTYISRIKSFFCGKWVCGLCAEAVKETMRRAPPTNSSTTMTMEDALESHAALCKHFNGTTRLNPNLSLAGAMREIARKSSQHRSSTSSSSSTNKEQNYCKTGMIGRSVSCVPRIN